MSGQVSLEGERARSGLRTLSAGIHQAAVLAIRAAVQAAEQSARGTTKWHDRTGTTRSTIHGSSFDVRGTVEAGGVSRFLENGTVPHIIVARGRALRFVVNGSTIFRKSVRHPGTKATRFMEEASHVGAQALDYGADYYVGEAVRRAR